MAEAELDAWIKAWMPQPDEEVDNDAIFALFKFCLASFLFHRKSGFLDNNTHSLNAIRCSPFWSEEIPYADRVQVAYPWTATNDTPEITGLPIDTLYLTKIEELKMEIQGST